MWRNKLTTDKVNPDESNTKTKDMGVVALYSIIEMYSYQLSPASPL